MRFIAQTGGKFRGSSETDPSPAGRLLDSIGMKHLLAFRTAYIERDISVAASELNTDRRAVLKMIQAIEGSAQDQLFVHKTDGSVSPTAFGERLFNDTNRLERHMHSLFSAAREIKERGRVLRLATSPAIFRTEAFRRIFSSLGRKKEFRLSFVPVPAGAAGRALSQGRCDLFIGKEELAGDRFAADSISILKCQKYRRVGEAGTPRPSNFSVIGQRQTSTPSPSKIGKARLLDLNEIEWVRWLDYPHLCDPGTVVLAPMIDADTKFWSTSDGDEQASIELHAYRMRQHSYEFLTPLSESLADISPEP